MKRLLLAIAGVTVFSACASAATISFNTSNFSFACNGAVGCTQGGGGSSLTFNTSGIELFMTWVPSTDTQVAPPNPVSASVGTLSLTCQNCTPSTDVIWNLTGASFSFTFHQTLPFVGDSVQTASFSSSSFGFKNNGQTGTARALFAPASGTSITSGNETVTYQVDQPALGHLLQLGNNTVQGLMTYQSTDVPEPGTLSIIGLGLVMLGIGQRRLRKS